MQGEILGAALMSPSSIEEESSPASLLREPVLSASPLSFLLKPPPSFDTHHQDITTADVCFARQKDSGTTLHGNHMHINPCLCGGHGIDGEYYDDFFKVGDYNV